MSFQDIGGPPDQVTNGCLDAEGSEEETAAFVHDYTEFVVHFPHAKHKKEARELLKDFSL